MTADAPSVTYPWIRQVRVTIGGLDNTGDMVFESDGSMNKYRISVAVAKHLQTIATTGVVEIFNLSKTTRNALQVNDAWVRIEAGWRDGPRSGFGIAFYGTLLSTEPERHGPDIVTRLFAQSNNLAATKINVSGTYGPGVPYRKIVLDIANAMRAEGVIVDEKMVRGVNGEVERCYAFNDTAGDVLRRLSSQQGFWWTIVDGAFLTVNKDPDGGGGIISRNTNTIREPWIISAGAVRTGYRRRLRGVRVKTIYDSTIVPGNEVVISSALDPSCNGRWRVREVEHMLDCHDNHSFTTSFYAEGKNVG